MNSTASHAVLPRHVAVIMDGNGRWAASRALPRAVGHRMGARAVRRVVESCAQSGVEVLTLFAFSSENWRRPREEVETLMSRFLEALDKEVGDLDRNGIRLHFIGDRLQLAAELRERIDHAERQTAANRAMTLIVAIAYGGRWDLTQAARSLAQACRDGKVRPEEIDEDSLGAHLALAGYPDPDLLIRTGGEQRVSNFLLWNFAYTELYFCDTLWPDFGADELKVAFDFFSRRQRRFGRTPDQVEAR